MKTIIEKDNKVSISDYEILSVKSFRTENVRMTINEITNKYLDEKLLIPEIQRGFVWDKEKAQRLILSIIQGYPIPPIITLRKDGVYIIIDGQQRLMTILWFMGKLTDEDFYVKEILGEPKLNPDKVWESYSRIGLTIDKDIINKLFDPKNISLLREWLKDRTIEFKIIEEVNDDNINTIVADIFMRINRGSTVLRQYDMVRALYYYDTNKYIKMLEKFNINKEI